VLYRDATWVTLPEDDPYAAIAPTWINGRCRDISKRTVQRVFAEVFGYPLAVDPLTYEGVCVRKPNRNAVSVNDVKDMLVMVGPIPADELSDEHVYERRIDGRVPGLGHVELYTYVVGGTVVSVLRDVRLDGMQAGRLAKMLDHSVVDARMVFSAQERTQIGGFCAAMGLDYGKLDIIRDREDRRLYILDANKTPHYNLAGWTDVTRAWFLHTVEQVVQTFPEHFPPRSVTPALRPTGGCAPGNDRSWLSRLARPLIRHFTDK
jgi:hypothetical protein